MADHVHPLLIESAASVELGTKWPPTQDVSDRNGEIGPLRIGDETFEWGLGCVAPTTIRFALDGSAQVFRAIVGVQYRPWIGVRGPTRFAVRVDGTERAQVIRHGSDLPQEFAVTVTGASVLELVAMPEHGTPHFERAAWAYACLEPLERPTEPDPDVVGWLAVTYEGVPGRLVTRFEPDPPASP